MAADAELADRVRVTLSGRVGAAGLRLEEKRMFGGLAFLVDGRMVVAVSGHGGLMVRCEPADTARHLRRAGTGPMVMREREVDGWLRVDAEHTRTDAQVARWVGVGMDAVRALPPEDGAPRG